MAIAALKPCVPLLLLLAAACDRAGNEDGPRTEPDVSTTGAETSTYVGSQICAGCHRAQHESWRNSHHRLAMTLPSDGHILGDFDETSFANASTSTTFSRVADRFVVRTEGADGELADFGVRYAFGVAPLQQYLLELPGGRLQAHDVAWDARPEGVGGQRWFHLRPDETIEHDDVLHWSGAAYTWNHACADCHSTAVEKNYEAASNSYATEYAEVSVGCEACHGPGSRHVEDPSRRVAALRDRDEQLNACAPCHSRRSQLAEGFTPERAYLDHYLPALLDEGLYFPDGQILDEVYVYGSFLQSKMHARGVACSDCHEPHSAELRREGNAVCTFCHSEAGQAEFPTLRRADYDSEAHHFHPTTTEGARCVSCHMPERTYMVIDDRRDHSFRVPRPDLTVESGVPNACNRCHRDQSAEWARAAVNDRFGPERPEHFAPVFAAARAGRPHAEPGLAAIAGDAGNPAIVRAAALSLMVSYERGVSAFAIERGLADDDPLVRIGALRAAERWPAARRFDKCEDLLQDEVLAVRSEAARILAPAYPQLGEAARRRLRGPLEAYLQILQLQADRAEGQTGIASVYLYLGDAQRAEQALLTARRLNPRWVPALVNLADLYRSSDRDARAGPLLAQAVSLAPDTPEVLVARALWLVRQQSTQEALGLLASAYQLAPQNLRHAYLYAVALNSTGQPEQALEVLDDALTLRPRNEQLLRAAFGIARDAGLEAETAAYLRRLESRWSPGAGR